MGKKRRRYSSEFKLEAVKLLEQQGRTVVDVAESLGIQPGMLHRWRAQYGKDGTEAFPGQGRLKPQDEELRRLQRDLARVRQERDILKKALAYFANEKR